MKRIMFSVVVVLVIAAWAFATETTDQSPEEQIVAMQKQLDALQNTVIDLRLQVAELKSQVLALQEAAAKTATTPATGTAKSTSNKGPADSNESAKSLEPVTPAEIMLAAKEWKESKGKKTQAAREAGRDDLIRKQLTIKIKLEDVTKKSDARQGDIYFLRGRYTSSTTFYKVVNGKRTRVPTDFIDVSMSCTNPAAASLPIGKEVTLCLNISNVTFLADLYRSDGIMATKIKGHGTVVQ